MTENWGRREGWSAGRPSVGHFDAQKERRKLQRTEPKYWKEILRNYKPFKILVSWDNISLRLG